MATTGSGANLSLRIVRKFSHPREEVFAAWAEASALSRWFAPSDEYRTVATADVRPGGEYRIEMHHKGGNVHVALGKYVEITRPSKLVFTWGWDEASGASDTLVTVEFHDLGRETEVVIVHERFPNDETRDKHEQGWNACLSRLTEKL